MLISSIVVLSSLQYCRNSCRLQRGKGEIDIATRAGEAKRRRNGAGIETGARVAEAKEKKGQGKSDNL